MYTAEEYREVLNKIYGMDSEKREKAFGKDEFVADYVEHYSAQKIIEKYRAYVNTPKVGEYWKRKVNDEMVVVRRTEKGMVYVYHCDSSTNVFTLKDFAINFTRTAYKSKYLEVFLEEMKEVGDAE